MSTLLDLGLGITIINVYYSLSYLLMWCVALQKADENEIEPFVWLTVYIGNVFLSAFLFLGLRKRDRWSVIIWFSLTLLWFLPKLYDHKRGCALDARGSTYRVINLIMEIYVILSFAVMMRIYMHLPKRKPAAKQRIRHSSNGLIQDVQMVDLGPKAAAIAPLATVEVDDDDYDCDNDEIAAAEEGLAHSKNNRGGMQQVSSIEFHRDSTAAASQLDGN